MDVTTLPSISDWFDGVDQWREVLPLLLPRPRRSGARPIRRQRRRTGGNRDVVADRNENAWPSTPVLPWLVLRMG